VHTATTESPPCGTVVQRWAPCPLCWGQSRIWEQVTAANGEGPVLLATQCTECLGIGEVLR
jgi:hypothetical protein